MKNSLIAMLILLTGCTSFTQDKIHSIDLEKITQVTAYLQSSDLPISEIIFDDEADVKKIVDFLRETEFTYATGSDLPVIDGGSEWKVKLTFKGQRDEMYFFEDHAFIGKSTFLIPEGTTKRLLKIIH